MIAGRQPSGEAPFTGCGSPLRMMRDPPRPGRDQAPDGRRVVGPTRASRPTGGRVDATHASQCARAFVAIRRQRSSSRSTRLAASSTASCSQTRRTFQPSRRRTASWWASRCRLASSLARQSSALAFGRSHVLRSSARSSRRRTPRSGLGGRRGRRGNGWRCSVGGRRSSAGLGRGVCAAGRVRARCRDGRSGPCVAGGRRRLPSAARVEGTSSTVTGFLVRRPLWTTGRR